MRFVDLHIHSTFSDGTLSPAGLIDLAEKRRIAAIALTDHDTMAATDEFLIHGRGKKVEVLPGIEISAWQGDTSMHILGYGLNHKNAVLQARLAELQQARHTRNKQIMEKLNRLGIAASLSDVEHNQNGQVGRPHIARLLVAKKAANTVTDAFDRFLKKGGAAYVENYRIHAADAIALIREAGGAAMLAHPTTIDPSLATIPALLKELKEVGLAGVEVYYPTHSKKTCTTLHRLAADLGLLACGGTDFHGDTRAGAPLGGSARTVRVPYAAFHELTAYLGEK